MKNLLVAMLVCVFLIVTAYAAEVKNLVSRQEGNRVVFEYDVIGEEIETEVIVMLNIEGKAYRGKDLQLEGDYGKVKPGKKKKIYWNVLQDFPKGFSGDINAEIVTIGNITLSENVFIGVSVKDLTPKEQRQLNLPNSIRGVVVIDVKADSPSATVLIPSDVILEINRKAISNIENYEAVVTKIRPSQDVLLLVFRRGSTIFEQLKANREKK